MSTTKEVSKNGTITTVKPNSNNMTTALSWKNVMNVFNVFDLRVSFALIRENLGTLLSVSKAQVHLIELLRRCHDLGILPCLLFLGLQNSLAVGDFLLLESNLNCNAAFIISIVPMF